MLDRRRFKPKAVSTTRLQPVLPHCKAVALSLLLLAPAMAWAQLAANVDLALPARVKAGPLPHDLETNPLILDVRLDGFILSDGLTAYQEGPEILLPLGELARLLTLAISVQPEAGRASGYVLRAERTFGLNLAQSLVSLAERETGFEMRRARVISDDIYVSSELLARWLPIDFEINLSTLQLVVKPREKLPLQERLERERSGKRLGAVQPERSADPGYHRNIAPYQLLGQPFIDQTFGANASVVEGSRRRSAAYTAYLTADVLGMEGAGYISSTRDQSSPVARLTLGRNDPDAGLLGPLRARSVLLGNISVPSVPNVMIARGSGLGVSVGNRPLDQPTSFDRQSLRGDLQPGWDVTLYYNEALLGFQTSRADGLYAFDDLPLSFGRNEFSLVFNGPLGQMRKERKTFLLDQSIVKPGQFLYSLVANRTDNGGLRSVALFDTGLTKAIVGSAGLVRMQRPLAGQTAEEERNYAQLGLRGYWDGAILTSELTSGRGGLLADLGLKTRLAGFAVDAQHIQVQADFDSDVFSASGDPVKMRDKVRMVGTLTPYGLPRMPVALEAQREQLKSGATNEIVSGRISLVVAGTSATNALSWQRGGGAVSTHGSLQMNRRIASMGLSGQLAYSLRPDARLDSLALAADRSLASGYRVSAGLLHTFDGGSTVISGGVSKNFGSFALALSSSYSSRRDLALGLQLFMALGSEPRTGHWFTNALPMAGTGAVSARAFVDSNLNGLRDDDEEWVPNAGFIINSSRRHPSRSDVHGTAFLDQLAPGRYSDIALDPETLEDPLWQPQTKGVRVLPRPGMVQMLEFPVISTSEIDGTVYLVGKNGRRGIGDALVELVDSQGAVVMSARSSSDGFFLLRHVFPGHYMLRTSPEQAVKLALVSSLPVPIEVTPKGDLINGKDLEMKLVPP